MELGARIGRAIAILFPNVAVFLMLTFVAFLGLVLLWRWTRPWRDEARRAQMEADRRQRSEE